MRHVPRFFAVAAVALFGLFPGPAQAAPVARPTLAIAQLRPTISIRGSHFAPAKRVRITLVLDGARSWHYVRTSTAGKLVVTFATPRPIDPCSDGFVVLAVGAAGERASVKFVPRECPPAP